MKTRNWFLLWGVLSLLVAILACNFTPQEESDTKGISTVQAEQTALAGTVTAMAQVPVPDVTQAPVPELPVQTPPPAQPAQTQPPALPAQTQPPAVPQAPVQTAPPGDLAATQAAAAPILAKLPAYGVDAQNGALAWTQGPLRLEINQYRGSKFDNKYPQVIAKDFVLSSDYTWNTQYGGAGCGFVFRSDGKQQGGNSYIVISTRLADGHIFFAVNAQGQQMIVKDFYAAGLDPHFDADNGATNNLTVVGRGSTFTIYSNGTRLGDVDPNKPLPALKLPAAPIRSAFSSDPAFQQAMAAFKEQVNKLKAEYERRRALWNQLEKDFPAGIVAMGTMADSGRTICEFDNAWLYLIGPLPGQ